MRPSGEDTSSCTFLSNIFSGADDRDDDEQTASPSKRGGGGKNQAQTDKRVISFYTLVHSLCHTLQ